MISGPYEFHVDVPPTSSSPAVVPPPEFTPDVLRTLYAETTTDVGYASPAALRWFGAPGLPVGFHAVGDTPVVRRVSVNSVRVVVILFPLRPDIPALTALARAQADADLILGVSPWGFRIEGQSLPELSAAFDLILGSGEGAPFPLEIPTFAPGILWSRADREARSVTRLDFFRLPGPSAVRPTPWLLGLHIRPEELLLLKK